MTGLPQGAKNRRRSLILGANGKIAAMVRRIWAEGRGSPGQTAWIVRRDPGAGDLAWAPGDTTAHLPRADCIVALWGVTPGAGRDLSANTALALAAMELARQVGATRVLHCSSAAVYPGGAGPGRETDDPAPWSPYGQAKAAMERALADWSGRNPDGPEWCAMRMANVAGADGLFAALEQGRQMQIDRFADGQGPRRSYLAPEDFAHALTALLDLPPGALPRLLNLTGPRPVAMEAIARAAGRSPVMRPAPSDALALMALSDERAARLIGPLTDSAHPEQLVRQWRSWGAVPA